ncbi:T9SS type A sorting domain-containing protein [Bacteroidota bacterium]
MIFIDGFYYMVTADAFLGDLIVMKYDENWNYIGTKKLIPEAHWSQGVAYDGMRFYVSYLNTSQRTPPIGLPVHLNVHLAAFDRDWNLLEDIAVTSFLPDHNKQPGRLWIILNDNKSYDQDKVDSTSGEEQLQWQAYVSVYELKKNSTSVKLTQIIPKEFQLEQNYPNPFNPVTTINFTLPNRQYAILKVYNFLGQEIAILFNNITGPGKNKVTFNAKDLPSGVYFYSLRTSEFVETKKFVMLK